MGRHIPVEWRVWSGDLEPSEFNVSDLEFIPFPENKMRSKRVRIWCRDEVVLVPVPTFKVNLGMGDANRLLDNQEEIPLVWRPMSIVFTRTLLRDPIDDLYVVGIDFDSDDGRWSMYFCKVGHMGDNWSSLLHNK